MKIVFNIARVKVPHSTECLTSGKDFLNPVGEGRAHQLSRGLLFLRHAVRAKLPEIRRLEQVGALMGGRLIFFLEGSFSFGFLSLKC